MHGGSFFVSATATTPDAASLLAIHLDLAVATTGRRLTLISVHRHPRRPDLHMHLFPLTDC